jgi:hypothetical protein
MSQIKTTFSPPLHGFGFANAFDLTESVDLDLPIYLKPVLERLDIDRLRLDRIVYGLCGGMCFAALDYKHHNQSRPTRTEAPRGSTDQALFKYLVKRQLDSLGGFTLLKLFRWMTMEDVDVERLSGTHEFNALQAALDKGSPQVLVLLRDINTINPTMNHQVLATGYRFDAVNQTAEVDLYDPNHPGRTPELRFHLRHPANGIHLVQTTREPLRGFFINPYQPRRPPR